MQAIKDRPPRLRRLLSGSKTHLGVNELWVSLFLENEARYKTQGAPRPRTDRELTLLVQKEFPTRRSAVWNRPTIPRYRYNAGTLYKGQTKPKIKDRSFRYNTKGERVPARYFDPFEYI